MGMLLEAGRCSQSETERFLVESFEYGRRGGLTIMHTVFKKGFLPYPQAWIRDQQSRN